MKTSHAECEQNVFLAKPVPVLTKVERMSQERAVGTKSVGVFSLESMCMLFQSGATLPECHRGLDPPMGTELQTLMRGNKRKTLDRRDLREIPLDSPLEYAYSLGLGHLPDHHYSFTASQGVIA